MSKMKKILLVSAIFILSVPVAAWAMYKPVRVLAPDWVNGVVCINTKICLEDKSRLQEAEILYKDAVYYVSSVTGAFQQNPRVIFCSTEDCYRSFGFKKASATTVGKSGIVVSPRGWKNMYLRHEMIHHRQAEELGTFSSLYKPEWLIEGMAYSLSNDPRQQLSHRWQQAREKFSRWLENVGNEHLWQEAKKI